MLISLLEGKKTTVFNFSGTMKSSSFLKASSIMAEERLLTYWGSLAMMEKVGLVQFLVLTGQNGTGFYLGKQHVIKCTADIWQRMEYILHFYNISRSCQVDLMVIC